MLCAPVFGHDLVGRAFPLVKKDEDGVAIVQRSRHQLYRVVDAIRLQVASECQLNDGIAR